MNSTPSTVYRVFRQTAAAFGDRSAIRFRRGGKYVRLAYRELEANVMALRRALYRLGVRRGDRVAILSYNRPEWITADLAVQGLGAVTVPIYHTLPSSQVAFYLRDSGAVAVFTEDAQQSAKLLDTRHATPPLPVRDVIQFVGEPPLANGGMRAIPYAELPFSASGDAELDRALDEMEALVTPDQTATFIYTSGTTGNPKGAMLCHTALLHTSWAARQVVHISESDVFLSFLPLCHVVERVGGYYLPISVGAEIVISEGPFALAQELAEAQPTAFICVPRVYDVVRERVMEGIRRMPPVSRALALWALRVGTKKAESRERGLTSGWMSAPAGWAADRLVLRKIRYRVSGGRIRFLVSGGAPLNPETGRFLQSIGLTVLEGYGLTEFPVISLNIPGRVQLGSVGHALPQVEVRLADDGEILVRGPSLMSGYWAQPEATAAAIDADGWLHTGDIGTMDSGGRLAITDRIKDIIVLANGKNVAPQPIESLLKQSPLIAEAVLFGDGQNSLVALIVPRFDELRRRLGRAGTADTAEITGSADAVRLVRAEINALSADLADYERIKQFRLLPREFSVDSDELTPTMKVKRRIVAERYADELAAMLR